MYNYLTDTLFPPFILMPVNLLTRNSKMDLQHHFYLLFEVIYYHLHTQSYQMLTYENHFLYKAYLLFPFVLSNDIILALTVYSFKLLQSFNTN